MYDQFSADYDRFVDWPARLDSELPFVEKQLRRAQAGRVLDVACGTGRHSIALAERGFDVAGTDVSEAMVERARGNAASAGVDLVFEPAGFGELAARVGGNWDALLCLGNSLPHLLTQRDLEAALADFAAVLRPEGLLLIQNRNFDRVLASRERWMEPQAHREDCREWLFLRHYNFESDGTLTFNVVTLSRDGTDEWQQRLLSTRLMPIVREALVSALSGCGFEEIQSYGDMSGSAFEPDSSPNLVITATRA